MKKIALIDNTGLFRIKFENVLVGYGFDDVFTCSIKDIETRGSIIELKQASLIFIDCDSGDVDYKKLISELREAISHEVAIVTMSSHTDQMKIVELLRYGADDILAKPYSDIKLMEKIFDHMKKPVLAQMGVIDRSSEMDSENRYMPKWHKDFEVGIESVDEEHRGLLEQYEKLYQVMRKGEGHEYSERLLEYLEVYVVTHFDNEEKLQLEINYNAYEEHKLIHNKFKKELKVIAAQFEEGGFDNQQLIKFSLFLKNWLMHHILVEDKKYMAFIQESDHKTIG